jgi:hypothetical protein
MEHKQQCGAQSIYEPELQPMTIVIRVKNAVFG